MVYTVLNQPISFQCLKYLSLRIDVFLVNMAIMLFLVMAEFISAENNVLFL